jgi:predicted secreted protein
MHWFTAIVLYVLIWWVVLFTVLPFGIRPIDEAGEVPGGWRGVPRAPRLGRKALATTLIAGLVWAACMGVIESDWISFRSGWLAMRGD